MKTRVEIELFGAGKKARLYAVRLPPHTKPEVARFFDRVAGGAHGEKTSHFSKALTVLLDWLNRIAQLDGAQERFFRPREGKGLALPIDKGPLRLYCYRLDDETLILCGGGIKGGQTVQESPDCLPHFDLMNTVINEIKRRHLSSAYLPTTVGEAFSLHITLPVTYDPAF